MRANSAITNATVKHAYSSGYRGTLAFNSSWKFSMTINRFDFNVGEGWNDTSWVAQDVAVDIKLDLKK